MPEEFDAYHKWLGIPAAEQPPHHYRLLAIPVFEQDRDVIAIAADRQMAHLRTFQSGSHSDLSQRLLNEVSAARLCLLDPAAKATYDAALKVRLKPAAKEGGVKKIAVRTAKPTSGERPGADRSIWPVDSAPPDYHRPGSKSSTSKSSTSAAKPRVAAASRKSKNPAAILIAVSLTAIGALAAIAYVALADRAGTPKQQPVAKKSASQSSAAPKLKQSSKSPQSPEKGSKSQLPAEDGKLPDFGEIKRQPPEPAPAARVPTPQPRPARPDPTQPPLDEREAELARYGRGKAIDLLSLIDVKRDGVHGVWRRDGTAIITPGESCSRIQIRHAPPEEYELTIVVERIAGDGCFNPGLIVGHSNVLVVIDGNGGLSGLDEVDGQRYPDTSDVFQGPVLTAGEPHTIVCAVRRNGVRASCDDTLLFHWVGDAERLSLYDDFKMPDPRLLSIADYQASFRITKYELRPLLPPE